MSVRVGDVDLRLFLSSGDWDAVSQNGSLVAARYEWDAIKNGTKVHIFVEHLEGEEWALPVNCFFVDGTGKSESVKITPESFTDTSEPIK